MTASTPCRSRSACHSSSASPTRSQASSASTSSHEPGKRTTPNFTTGPSVRPADVRTGPLPDDLVVLDQRVSQQPLAHLLHARRVLDVEFDEPPDVYVRD